MLTSKWYWFLFNFSIRFRTSNVPPHGSNGSAHASTDEHETPRSNPLPFTGSSAHGCPCSAWRSSWRLVAKVDWHLHSLFPSHPTSPCVFKVKDCVKHTAQRTVYCSHEKIWSIMAPPASMNWKGRPVSEQTTTAFLKDSFGSCILWKIQSSIWRVEVYVEDKGIFQDFLSQSKCDITE